MCSPPHLKILGRTIWNRCRAIEKTDQRIHRGVGRKEG